MKIHCEAKLMPIEGLKLHPKNRNKHSKKQIDRLCKILTYQGWRYPIKVSNLSGYITSGHGRLMAAKKLGMKQVPVSFQDYDNDDQEYADVQSDNAIASWAELDLSMINEDIGDIGPDFDLDLLGIENFTVDAAEKGLIDDNEVPEVKESFVKLGDLWQLGEHRLLCGDSTNIQQVEKLMNGEKADMVFTDPPYGMFLDTDYTSMDSGMGENKNFKPVMGDNEDFKPELINSIFASFSYCKELFIFGADYFAELIPDRNKGSWVIWDKSVTESMDRGFGSAWESCWSKARHKRTFARILWRGLYGKKDDQKERTHPTQKPVHLAEWFFEQLGKDTKSVVDLFGGSGSTLIACEKTKRKCFMMELDPHYCGVIIERWQKYTGQKAERVTEK